MVAEVLETPWEMEGAQETLERQNKSRIELLEEASVGECVKSCNVQWLSCAREVLQRNEIEEGYFTGLV